MESHAEVALRLGHGLTPILPKFINMIKFDAWNKSAGPAR